MKMFLILSLLLSFNLHAEVKPARSIVPTQCASFAPGQDPEDDSIVSICVNKVTGYPKIKVFSVSTNWGEVSYYVGKDSFKDPISLATLHTACSLKVTDNGRYILYSGAESCLRPEEFKHSFYGTKQQISYKGYTGDLEVMFTTLSVQ